MGMRNDIVIATGERFPDAVTGNFRPVIFSFQGQRKSVQRKPLLT